MYFLSYLILFWFVYCLFLLFSSAAKQELSLKNTMANQLDKALQEHQHQLEARDVQSQQHNDKLKNLQEQAGQATTTVQYLEVSLAECRKEIEVYIKQLDEARKTHEEEVEDNKVEVCVLQCPCVYVALIKI